MNLVPLILILILGVRRSSQVATSPCTDTSPQSQYNNFKQRHILQSAFDRNSLIAWKSYLKKNGLWCREIMQSFMETSQDDICTANGLRVNNGGNLCMSSYNRLVYDIFTNIARCQINVTPRQTRVVVACNKVRNMNRCLPVHYQRYNNQIPSITPCS